MALSSRLFESLVGAVVLGFVGWFFFSAYGQRGYSQGPVYSLNARFERADGLFVGSDVKISGVKIGVVRSLSLDPTTYQAVVAFDLQKSIQLPQDTAAEIGSDSFLGSKHLRLIAGNADDMLQSGDFIDHTQSLPSLESLIGQFIFSTSKSSDKSSKKTPSLSGPSAP